MENFTFQNGTKIIFGKDTEKSIGREIKKYSSKILFCFGGGSIKRSGLYDTVVASLKENNIEFYELSGIQPNPRLNPVREGIKICREKGLDFVLSVGGGSAGDTAKAIAAGVLYPIFGILLSPMIAALAMSFSSVSVISNSLRLRSINLK